jgi:hypothetical protein
VPQPGPVAPSTAAHASRAHTIACKGEKNREPLAYCHSNEARFRKLPDQGTPLCLPVLSIKNVEYVSQELPKSNLASKM